MTATYVVFVPKKQCHQIAQAFNGRTFFCTFSQSPKAIKAWIRLVMVGMLSKGTVQIQPAIDP